MPRVRTVFMGSDPIALPLLRALPEICPALELVGVFTQPDRPRGRGQKISPNPIKEWALARGVPVRQPERVAADDEAWLRETGVTIGLVMAFGQILKPSLLEIPAHGCFNFHASRLPRLRGASPLQTALASGEATTGVSFMRVIPALDAGPYSEQEPIRIGAEMSIGELIAGIAAATVKLAARALPAVVEGSARFREQDPAEVTYCRRIFAEDANLDFHRPARALERRIRAFQPWPGARLPLPSGPLKIGAARVVAAPGGEPGAVHQPTPGSLVVACGEDGLELLALQRPGGRMVPTADFLRGHAIAAGTIWPSRPMAPLVAPRPFPWKWRPGDPPPAGAR